MYVGHENTKEATQSLRPAWVSRQRERGSESVIVWERMKSKAREWGKSIGYLQMSAYKYHRSRSGDYLEGGSIKQEKRVDWEGMEIQIE